MIGEKTHAGMSFITNICTPRHGKITLIPDKNTPQGNAAGGCPGQVSRGRDG